MSNILWIQSNGSLALTSVFPSTLADMERAAALDSLTPSFAETEASREALRKEGEALEAERKAIEVKFEALQESPSEQGVEALARELEKVTSREEELIPIMAKAILNCVDREFVDEVKANIGLNLEAHAVLLQTPRGPDLSRAIPEDWMLAGFNVDWPETGWAHESHRWDGEKIVVDMEEARGETKTRLRRERAPLYEANDLVLRDAVIEADEAKRLTGIAERDRLRGITKLADQAATLDELKEISVASGS